MPSKTWSNSVGSSSGATLTLDHDGIAVAGSTATIKDPEIRFYSKSGWSDSTNYIKAKGGAVVDKTWSNLNLNGGTTTLQCTAQSVALEYGSTVTASFSAEVHGISFFNGDSNTKTYTWTITYPARPYALPRPPLDPVLVKTSDTSHTVSWTANKDSSSGAQPWSNVHVERWDNLTGGWYEIAILSGSAVSYTDTSTVANRLYSYRVRAKNSTGFSTYADFPQSWTTPAAPLSLTASKDGTNVVLSWVNTAHPDATVEVWESQNGGAYALLHTTTAGASTWTDSAAENNVTHRYKVRAKVTGPLVSAFSDESPLITLLGPPNAPSGLFAGVFDAAEDLLLGWSHNPVDLTDQTAYELAHRVAGTETWTSTGKVTSVTSARLMPAGTFTNGQSYEWQVRTWGQHADASSWSAPATIVASARPVATILSPADLSTVSSSTLSVSWSVFDAEGTAQSAYRLSVHRGEELVREASGSVATTFVAAGVLQDGETYTVTLEVRDGSGLWSHPTQATFTVEFLPPMTPLVVAEWAPDEGLVYVGVSNPEPLTIEPPVVSNDVYRVLDGTETLIATVPENSTIADRLVPLGRVVGYRVVAHSDLPSSASSALTPVQTAPHKGFIWLNGGPGFAQAVRLYGKLSTSFKPARQYRLYAGREKPVVTTGTARTRTFSIAAKVRGDASPVAEVEELADLAPPFCYRDPLGHKWFVSIDSVDGDFEKVSSGLSITITEVDHRE